MNQEIKTRINTGFMVGRIRHGSTQKGFALIFSILATSVLLAISSAIWNLAIREVVLSSFGRESQIAFYATDAGVECALYWDFKGAFAANVDLGYMSAIYCGSHIPIFPTIISSDATSAVTTFSIAEGLCADIKVTKTKPEGSLSVHTMIESRGHNTCNVSDLTYVERGLRVNY
ncbi:MAG: hypothetical protein EXS46_03605 [Candidatus Taylorbacteria bacterium]|nr:hypothetical protein [Candidatus Taylorbacteria bacterium]